MKADEMKCPRCAETIKADALICRHCGYEFSPEEIEARTRKKQDTERKGKIGCAIISAILLLGIGTCAIANRETPEEAAAREKEAAENVRKGFNCLSGLDGSNRDFVDKVKATLRDPSTFEHVETRIMPADDKGDHAVVMQYRANNGFGGKNVLTAMGVVHASCNATVVASGLEEGR